jgi:hypothetical protein
MAAAGSAARRISRSGRRFLRYGDIAPFEQLSAERFKAVMEETINWRWRAATPLLNG